MLNRSSRKNAALEKVGAASADRDAEAASAISAAGPVVELLGRQLHGVVDQTEEAVVGLMGRVEGVDRSAAGLADEVQRLTESSAEHARHLARLGQDNAEVVKAFLAEVTARDAAVLGLVQEVRNLESHVDQIRQMARATNVLALNAKIEAMRAGEFGPGFQVVADEVRRIALDSDRAATDVSAGISRVSSMIEQKLVQADAGDRPSLSDGLSRAQQNIGALMDKSAATLNEAISGIDRSARTLDEMTTGLAGELQFQDITRQSIETVSGGLERLQADLGLIADYVAGKGETLPQPGATMARIQDSYVMSSQREVHGGSEGAGEALIELF